MHKVMEESKECQYGRGVMFNPSGDEQQDPTVQPRELHLISQTTINKEYIYISVSQSLCCTAEYNTVNQLYFNKNFFKKKK